ncbi:unnamed protein product [Orchesella dallaii]|uniref:DOMON domain-containing protein n=1 Tax=Orchesella dallaii TaxID=48710 RepID=A0ABP1PQF3_9HEXA
MVKYRNYGKENPGLWGSIFFVSFLCLLTAYCDAYMVGNNPHHRVEVLDPLGRYELEWLVDWESERVIFNVTVRTTGYIGFGLSSNGRMRGADIVTGGVAANGEPYFTDRHSVGDELPEIDTIQDWVLHKAWESHSHTFLSFSRAFDTCDPQDYVITEDRIALIWAIGEKDNDIQYHHQNRGFFNVHLIHPDYTPPITRQSDKGITQVLGKENTDLRVWTISRSWEIPSDHTTYWCTMHSPPKLPHKHHVVGFEVRFDSEENKKHVHHIVMFKCNAPRSRSTRSLFEPFLGYRGQQCLAVVEIQPGGPIPTEYCTEMFLGWAIGSRTMFIPQHVGIPFAESPDEYYLLQVHYDNPNQLTGLEVGLKIDFFYTSKLRAHDGAMMMIGHQVPGLTPSFLIPPSSIGHSIYGHCGSMCTRRMLPTDGINLVAVSLHSHNSGRQMKLQHFRKNRELPWIASDSNYAFNFQQFRVMRKEVKMLQGDHIIMKCVYDSTWTNGTVVGGFSTRQDMCLAFLIYYNKLQDFSVCQSEIISEDYRNHFLNVQNITWTPSQLEFVVDPPESMGGLTISEVSDNFVEWNVENRAELQRFHFYHPQINSCPRDLYTRNLLNSGESQVDPDDFSASVIYPSNARVYQPKETCSFAKNT